MRETSFTWDHPLDPVAITTEAVAARRQPVLRVCHEEGHGGWQFYDDTEPLGEPVVMPKEDLLALDPSLSDVIDLPLGWEAVREEVFSPWMRAKIAESSR